MEWRDYVFLKSSKGIIFHALTINIAIIQYAHFEFGSLHALSKKSDDVKIKSEGGRAGTAAGNATGEAGKCDQ